MHTHAILFTALLLACGADPTPEPSATTPEPTGPWTAGEVGTLTTDLDGGDGLARTSTGLIRVSEPQQHRIQTVDPTTGAVTPFVDGLSEPYGISLDADGQLYVANWAAQNVLRITEDGVPSEFATVPGRLGNVFVDTPTGDIYLPSFHSGLLEKVSPDGTRSEVATGVQNQGLHAVMFDGERRLYTGYVSSGEIYRHDADGVGTLFAKVPGNLGNLLWSEGTLFATGWDTHQVYAIDDVGNVEVFVGTGKPGKRDGQALDARVENPNGLLIDAENHVMYVSESVGRIRTVALERA